jgi:hypothetical protein
MIFTLLSRDQTWPPDMTNRTMMVLFFHPNLLWASTQLEPFFCWHTAISKTRKENAQQGLAHCHMQDGTHMMRMHTGAEHHLLATQNYYVYNGGWSLCGCFHDSVSLRPYLIAMENPKLPDSYSASISHTQKLNLMKEGGYFTYSSTLSLSLTCSSHRHKCEIGVGCKLFK